MTINGRGFGATNDGVYLKQDGLIIPLPIIEWADHAITIVVPQEAEGLCDLVISCALGEAIIPNYVDISKNLQNGVDHSCSTSPYGLAYYLGKVWVFQARYGQNFYFYVSYHTYDMSNGKWSKCTTLEINGSDRMTDGDAKVAPVIVNNRLLAFWFDNNQDVKYAMYNGQGSSGTDVWEIVPGTAPNVKQSHAWYPNMAPLYNPTTNRLELYFTPSSGESIVCFYADVPDPDAPFELHFQQAHPSTPLPKSEYGPGATIVRTGTDQNGDPTYQTMLAYADDKKHIHIDYLDGNYNSTRSDMLEGKKDKTADTPSLVNLENGLVALLWKGPSGYGNWSYYDWRYPNQGEDYGWVDHKASSILGSNWTGVAAYEPIVPGTGEDTNYPDMKGKLFCMFTDWFSLAQWRVERDLGLWRYESVVNTDMSDGLLNPDGTPGPTFAVSPVLAVVDAPPFAVNGKSLADNKTYFKLGKTDGSGTSFDMSLKAGPYFEAGGASCPFTMQVSAGVTYASDRTFTKTLTVTNILNVADPPEIMLVLLTPLLDFVEYERYDAEDNRTGDTFTMVNVTDISLHFQPWSYAQDDFDDNFPRLPRHKAGCVNSYSEVYDDSLVFTKGSNDWHYTPTWDSIMVKLITVDTEMDNVGSYYKFKIGGGIAGIFGLGVEGEFDVTWTSTTTVSTETALNLWNPEDTLEGDVTQFDVTAYWLKPKDDAEWVPSYRQGSGDQPWFITYRVTNPVYIGGNPPPLCN